MATKNAHWQAAFRRRMREAGLKAVTVWMPKEGAVRLARYPEKERGEVITRALVLLESQGELTGNDATLTGGITGEGRDFEPGEAEEDTLTLAGLFTRLERVEAILSTITSNSTGVLTGDDTILTGESTDKSTGEVAVTITEAPPPPVTELTEPPAGLPPKRVAALSRRAKRLSAQGVSWKEIARRFNAEGVQTISGQGQWYGSTVKHMIEKHGREA
jgi:recombinase